MTIGWTATPFTAGSYRHMVFGLLAVVFVVFAGGNASPARAETASCLPYDTVSERLSGQHNEAPSGMGLTNNGHVLQLFRSTDGATWTLVLVTPEGLACPMAAGDNWADLPRQVAGIAS